MRYIGKFFKWLLIGVGGIVGCIVAMVVLLLVLSQLLLTRTPEWNYIKGSDKTVVLMEYKGDAETLAIPEELEGLPVTRIGVTHLIAQENSTLREVTIPQNITKVYGDLFYNCRALENIYVAEGHPAFVSIDGMLGTIDGRTMLCFPNARTSCVVPADTEILVWGFGIRSSVTTVVLPEGLKKIESYVFYECENLAEVAVPASVTTIEAGAFKECPKLTLVVTSGSEAERYAAETGIPYRLAE